MIRSCTALEISLVNRRNTKLQWIPSSFSNTYIIGHYNPSVRIIDLLSHTTYVVCVNFIHEWLDPQSANERQFFETLFHAIFIHSQSSQSFCRNIFHISPYLICLGWSLNLWFTSNKPKKTHYLLLVYYYIPFTLV